MEIRKTNREEFMKHMTPCGEDGFAKTFVAKCNMIDAWGQVFGAWEGNELLGAIVMTISKTQPLSMNLQLLHTFAKHRFKGVGKALCNYAVSKAHTNEVKYFRVSAEPEATEFYKKCGFKFWGKQKSKCSLCIFKVGGLRIQNGVYDPQDPFTLKKLFRKGKGALVEYNQPLCAE